MNEKQIARALQRAHMTEHEKAELRGRLHAHMRAHPAGRPVVSPLSFTLHMRAWSFALILFLIVSSGAGIAFAAEDSLPGDTLYPVKVNVTEPVRVALARGDENQAQIEEKLLNRRLEETEQLALRGELSDDRKDIAHAALERQIQKMESRLAVLSAENTELFEDTSLRLAALSDAHTTILDTIQADEGKDLQEHLLPVRIALRDSYTTPTNTFSIDLDDTAPRTRKLQAPEFDQLLSEEESAVTSLEAKSQPTPIYLYEEHSDDNPPEDASLLRDEPDVEKSDTLRVSAPVLDTPVPLPESLREKASLALESFEKLRITQNTTYPARIRERLEKIVEDISRAQEDALVNEQKGAYDNARDAYTRVIRLAREGIALIESSSRLRFERD